MDLDRATSLLVRHPTIFAMKALARLARRLPGQLGPSRRRFGSVEFVFPGRDHPATREMRWGLYEPETVRLLRQRLRPGDTFIDAGANIGYLSAIAAGLVGPGGQVHAFEPVPDYFESLQSLSRLNRSRRIFARRVALGEKQGTASISVAAGSNIGWNTMVPGFMRPADTDRIIEVPVVRLDAYLEDHGIGEIALIKIDTEGFELPILRGLERFFASGGRPPIICEVAPAAYSLLGRDVKDLFEYLAAFSYRARTLMGRRETVRPDEVLDTMNVLFEST